MTEDTPDQVGDDHGITSPDEPTHEATTPPGENAPDPEKVDQAEDDLGKAGGGH